MREKRRGRRRAAAVPYIRPSRVRDRLTAAREIDCKSFHLSAFDPAFANVEIGCGLDRRLGRVMRNRRGASDRAGRALETGEDAEFLRFDVHELRGNSQVT